MSSYLDSLKAAGVEVIDACEFGDYEGSWYAVVKYNNQYLMVEGSYGSCSGCDAFLAEFGYIDYNEEKYKRKLIEFGKGYLVQGCDLKKAIENAEKDCEWDIDSEQKLKWLKMIYNQFFSDKIQEIIKE
jgi:hypothetical protein